MTWALSCFPVGHEGLCTPAVLMAMISAVQLALAVVVWGEMMAFLEGQVSGSSDSEKPLMQRWCESFSCCVDAVVEANSKELHRLA